MKKNKLCNYFNLRQSAFTIVELIVVVTVIGVLAAITTISYTGIANKAIVASLTSDLENASKLLSMDQVVDGIYPATLAAANGGKGLPASSGTTYEYFPTSTSFCVTATKNSVSYRITNNSPPRMGICSGLERDMLSMIKWDSWTVGVGGTTGYSVNGDGNSRVIDINPWGVSDIIWDVSNQDVLNDADGGWNGSSFPIDNTKMYRFSVFVRRKTIGDGRFYLGTHGYPDAVLNRSNGVANTNPYFYNNLWWGGVNQWFLVVGYVWPSGSGIGSSMNDSGVHTMSGTKLFSSIDYVWQSTSTSSHHRSYLYYSIDITTNQQFYQPRVDVVDGTEPTISELLNDAF